MRRKAILFVAAASLFAFFVASVSTDASSDIEIGSKLEGFTMPDPNGKDHKYDDLKGKNGSLIIFLSAQCPVVRQYNDRVNELAETYKDKGINFIGIYPNVTESVEWVKEHSEANYKFTTLIDKNHVFADQLGATRTPEVYYFSEKDILDYHGAIDNDRRGENITKEFLRTAFEQKLSGKEITEKETRAFGCSIKRNKKKKQEVGSDKSVG